MRLWVWVGTCAIVAGLASSARGITVGAKNDFQDGTAQGWTGGVVTPVASGGPDGIGDRFISLAASINFATFNNLPQWQGNYAAAGVANIELDMRNPNATPMEMRIVLFNDGSIGDRWTSTVAQTVPADNAWHHFTFSLLPGDMTQVLGSSPYAATYGSVERLMIRYDPGPPDATGVFFGGTLDIDNVTATAIPEPAALALLAAAGALALRRR